MEIAEISDVLFASCFNAPKRGKKCEEFKALYQTILKLLFCGHISLLQRKHNTTSNFTSHGQEVRNLAKVPYWKYTCLNRSTHLLGTFGHESKSIPQLRAQNYSTIRLLTLRVKFDEISQRTAELEHLPWTAFIGCIWNILSLIKAPLAKKCSSSDLCIFGLLSSTKSVPMYLVTCWKYKQSHIFISPCRNDPSQLQNCRTKRFFHGFLGLWA